MAHPDLFHSNEIANKVSLKLKCKEFLETALFKNSFQYEAKFLSEERSDAGGNLRIVAHPCAESSNELFKVLGNWNYILKHTSLCERLPEKKTKRYKPKNDSPLNLATLRPYKKLKVEKAQAMGGDHDE